MSNCSTIHGVQKVWRRRCCYFQHGQSFQKFFTGSLSKRDLVYLLFFSHTDVWRMTEWNTERQISRPLFWVAAGNGTERHSRGGRGESGIKLLNVSYKRDKERKQLPCVSLIEPGKTWQLGHLVFRERYWRRWASQALDAIMEIAP